MKTVEAWAHDAIGKLRRESDCKFVSAHVNEILGDDWEPSASTSLSSAMWRLTI